MHNMNLFCKIKNGYCLDIVFIAIIIHYPKLNLIPMIFRGNFIIRKELSKAYQ